MDLLTNLLPLPPLAREHVTALRALPRRFAAFGYTPASVTTLLKISDIPHRHYPHIVSYRHGLRGAGALGRCVGFFLLQERLTPAELAEIVGEAVAAVMEQLNWLEAQGDRLRSRVDLYPCLDHYFFTDTMLSRVAWQQQVYCLGVDSYALARGTPRRAIDASLDICAGSGVHAVLAANHSRQSWGVDINQRALQFSRVNAILNSVDDHCEFLRSDCYAAVSERSYDLITLNPPFVPTPEGMIELFRTGGNTGEAITERVVRALPERLTRGGVFSMFTEAPVLPNSLPLDRLNSWLPAGQFGVAALYHYKLSPESYIGSHLINFPIGKLEPEFERWLSTYEQVGISEMWSGCYYAVHLPVGAPSFRHERWICQPWYDYSKIVDHWLQALETWEQPMPDDFVPRLHPLVYTAYFSNVGALVDFKDPCWAPNRLELPRPVAELLHAIMKEPASLQEVQDKLGWDRAQLRAVLGELGRELVITSWTNPNPRLETLLAF